MAFSSIHEWALQFIKHKDVFERKVASIEPSEAGVRVVRKDGSVVIWQVGDDFRLPSAQRPGESRVVVCRNTKGNVKAIVKSWKELVKDPALAIWCVNLESGEKWSVNPRIHDLIADSATLEQGLLNLMDTANGVVKQEPARRRKKQSMFEDSGEDAEGSNEES